MQHQILKCKHEVSPEAWVSEQVPIRIAPACVMCCVVWLSVSLSAWLGCHSTFSWVCVVPCQRCSACPRLFCLWKLKRCDCCPAAVLLSSDELCVYGTSIADQQFWGFALNIKTDMSHSRKILAGKVFLGVIFWELLTKLETWAMLSEMFF